MIIACGQNDVMPDTCVCGFWLHSVTPGGFAGPHGWRYCSPECIDGQVEHDARQRIATHVNQRDLLCACSICTERGLPTQAMRDEYAEYRRVSGGGEQP